MTKPRRYSNVNCFLCLRVTLLVLIIPVIYGASISAISAQGYVSIENANSKLIKNYEAAKELSNDKEYDKAIARLDKILKAEPRFIDALILKSETMFAGGDISAAIEVLEESIAIDSLYNIRNLYSLARLYEISEDYSAAANGMQAYLTLGNLNAKRNDEIVLRISSLEFKDSLVNAAVNFDPVILPGLVNTDADEALAAVTIDGKSMVFTRREGGIEDLYHTAWNEEKQQWGTGIPVSSINSVLNEGAHAISADGTVIAFTSCNRRNSMGSCDIYVARQLNNGKWTAAINPEELNSTSWDGQPAMTADGRGMYFSSGRKGGEGGRDLWYSEFATNGRWSTPVNCGSVINSSGNESSPFLHYDDRTLYFMSDGHPGMGDYDIFTAVRLTDTWSKPQNMGYPINTTKREGGLSVHPNGQIAYFTVESEKGGTMDIYQFNLPESLQPGVISYLTGLVFDTDTKLPVEATITIYPLQDPIEEHVYTVRTDGTFTAALAHGQPYGLHVTAPGYTFFSMQFDFDSVRQYGNEDFRIPLQPLNENDGTSGEPIVLQNVEFESGSSTLLESSYSELELLLNMLLEYPGLMIEIHGHTDNVGDPKSNLTLSKQRAKAVYEWLKEKDVTADRISYKGFGEANPIDTNHSEEGRQRNRRTEFIVLRS